jgi:hypothetical protein
VTDQSSRDVLPIPDRPYEGELPLDAKDPEATFPPIEPLLPPRARQMCSSFCSTTSASALRVRSAGRARHPRPSGSQGTA